VVNDLLAIDRQGESLTYPHIRERRLLQLRAIQAIELEDGLHGAWDGDDAQPGLFHLANRFWANAGDVGLARAHHVHAFTFLGHQQNDELLEVRGTTPVGIVHGFVLYAIVRHTADKLPVLSEQEHG